MYAFLNAGLKIVFKDERPGHEQSVEYHYSGGIIDFVRHLNQSKEALFKRVASFTGDDEDSNGFVCTDLCQEVQDFVAHRPTKRIELFRTVEGQRRNAVRDGVLKMVPRLRRPGRAAERHRQKLIIPTSG